MKWKQEKNPTTTYTWKRASTKSSLQKEIWGLDRSLKKRELFKASRRRKSSTISWTKRKLTFTALTTSASTTISRREWKTLYSGLNLPLMEATNEVDKTILVTSQQNKPTNTALFTVLTRTILQTLIWTGKRTNKTISSKILINLTLSIHQGHKLWARSKLDLMTTVNQTELLFMVSQPAQSVSQALQIEELAKSPVSKSKKTSSQERNVTSTTIQDS